jgi:hypothetical protein
MSAEHTPGPWATSVDFIDPVPKHCYRSDDGCEFHSIARAFGPNSKANARLIAAAPDLLDAAKLALHELEWEFAPMSPGAEALRAAIAKAEGR